MSRHRPPRARRAPALASRSITKRGERQPKPRPRRKSQAATACPRVWSLPPFADEARAIAICEKVLKNKFVGDRDRSVAKLLSVRPDEVVFWPEHFGVFFTLAAVEVGIDVRAFGAKLDPKAAKPGFVPAAAFRTVAEVAGVYAENSGALTLFKVHRSFLTAMTAALIGIATGKVTDDPTLAGALSGVGGLLINILAQRYLDDGAEPETDWLEEWILETLQRHGPQSICELHRLTNIRGPLLNRALRGLIRKKLVVRSYRWDGGRTVIYGIEKISYDGQ
jgi:hypothetical protein